MANLAEYKFSGWTRCCYSVLDTLARNGGYADLAGDLLSASGKKRVVRLPGLVRRSPYGKRGVKLTREGWELITYCRDMAAAATVEDPEVRAFTIAGLRDGYDAGMLLCRASRKPVI